MTSGLPNLSNISCAVIFIISSYQSIFSCCLSNSMVYVSHPCFLKAFAIERVPLNKSKTLI